MAAYERSRLEACGGLSTAGLSAKADSIMHHKVLTPSLGQFFLVVHQFAGGPHAEQWWAQTHTKLKDDKSSLVHLMHNEGFHLHAMFHVVNGGPVFCLWEGTSYKTPSNMQDYVDKFVPGPGLGEIACVIHPIVTELVASSPWTVGVQSFFAKEDIKLPNNRPPLCAANSSFYIVQHIFKKPQMASTWWQSVQHMSAVDAIKMEASQHAVGLHPLAFWPTTNPEGIKYYLWELKEGRTQEDLQAALDGSGPHMAGTEVMVNHVYEVDKGVLDVGKGLSPCWPVEESRGEEKGTQQT